MKEKDFLLKLAKREGNSLLKYFNHSRGRGMQAIRGSVKGVTTKYDKIIDKSIISAIKKAFPSHNILTEESGFIDRNSRFTWIIDSLDGTVNFACGNPLFALCIALVKENQLIMGVIYAPAIKELYFAEKGKGAFLNNKKIHVSKTGTMDKSYVYMCEGGEKNRKRTALLLNSVYPRVLDVRKLGSAGIEAAWVALGRGEGYITTSIEPWDVAPGVLLVKEAGGRVTDFKGNEWQAKRSDMIFSNSLLHPYLKQIVRE